MNVALLIQFMVAAGGFTALAETVRWWLGRGKSKVDAAKVVQGMALDLVAPIHTELAGVRKDMRTLRREMNDLIDWAFIAKSLLDSHGISYPPVPDSLAGRSEQGVVE